MLPVEIQIETVKISDIIPKEFNELIDYTLKQKIPFTDTELNKVIPADLLEKISIPIVKVNFKW